VTDSTSPSLQRIRRWISCVAIVIALLAVAIAPLFWSGPRPEGVPYGMKLVPGTNSFGMQDFACYMNYLRQIQHRSVEHPYRIENQERIFRNWCPKTSMGFPHGYSPVALVLALPFLALKVEWAYFLWTLIDAGLFLALTWGYLFRRMKNLTQGFAIMALFCSYLPFDIFNMGQTALATTCLSACGYLLLRDRAKRGLASAGRDILLALTLYALAAKPSIGMILFAMAVSQRAWRPVILAGAGLMLTWALLAPRYGGYIEGLKDYIWLLNHYCDADLTPFLRGSLGPAVSTSFTPFVTAFNPEWNEGAFLLGRFIFESLIVLLMFLGWSKRISLSTQFQGLLWAFLLFCPYLLVTEDFALCLLVVEGTFFRDGLGGAIKVLLVWVAANIWIGTLLHCPLPFAIKLVLAVWWLLELILRPSPSVQAVPAPS
jgi:hypothetical protein